MPEHFDPRSYMAAGDWEAVLPERGWIHGPGRIQSVRKDYFSGLGWRMHVWVEKEGPENDDDVLIIAFGPDSSKLGEAWVEHEQVLSVVDELEKLIDLEQPYETVSARVMQFLQARSVNEHYEYLSLSKQRDNWITCQGGAIKVRWMGSRWLISPRGHHQTYADDLEVRAVVNEYIAALGGRVR